ncbi:MAG TPA: pyridoxamine 5'-phosphate oxidase family protein [Ktedonobacterales bacterium]
MADQVNAETKTERVRIRRHPERAVPERAEEILRAGRVAHVGFAVEGQPFVIPLTYLYADGTLFLHGAPASRALRTLATGTPVCVEVTLLDGLVASREAKSHSVNYRSVVLFGTAAPVTDLDTKRAIFERMTAHYFPGRTAGRDYVPARMGDLRGVELVAVRIEERGAKVRSGPPLGKHDGDETALGTSYVVELGGDGDA